MKYTYKIFNYLFLATLLAYIQPTFATSGKNICTLRTLRHNKKTKKEILIKERKDLLNKHLKKNTYYENAVREKLRLMAKTRIIRFNITSYSNRFAETKEELLNKLQQLKNELSRVDILLKSMRKKAIKHLPEKYFTDEELDEMDEALNAELEVVLQNLSTKIKSQNNTLQECAKIAENIAI